MKVDTIRRLLSDDELNPSLLHHLRHDPRKGVMKALDTHAAKLVREQDERNRLMALYELERNGQDFGLVAGIDEAGRGPLAGPVYAACVALPLGEYIPRLRDSKKIQHAERAALRRMIEDKAIGVGWGYASVEEIDGTDILQATFLAMRRAFENLSVPVGYLLVDGNGNPGFPDVVIKPVVGGDDRSASIAAASIIAKERRDAVMLRLHELYPQYGFATHKGYGTAEHYEAIRRYGPCVVHRMSFLKNMERE